MADRIETNSGGQSGTPEGPLKGLLGASPRAKKIIENITAWDAKKKLAAGAAIALSATALIGASLWSTAPTYSILFSNLPEAEGGVIVDALKKQGVPYKLSANGATIMIPEQQVHDLRLQLASQGLPKDTLVGFEVMENQRLGISQFQEQVNYQRALEGELARTIRALDAVSTARVHLGIPKQTGFLRDNLALTASVMVTLKPGRSLEKDQVAGIVHLVSASVARMKSENVEVVDQYGNLLTKKTEKIQDDLIEGTQLRYVKRVEEATLARVERLLNPILGKGNYSAQVSAAVDFNHVEETEERYRPNPVPEQAIRSQQLNESLTGRIEPIGVPGATSNNVPREAEAAATRDVKGSSKSSTVNYELDKSVRHTRHSTGKLERLSVAVVVNHRQATKPEEVAGDTAKAASEAPVQLQEQPYSEQELALIEGMVKEAIGFNSERGDTISVSSVRFEAPERVVLDETSFFDEPENRAFLIEVIKYLALFGGFALFYFGAVRPLISSVTKDEAKDEDKVAVQAAAGVVIEEEMIPPASFDIKLGMAKELAKNDPQSVISLIRKWVKES